jgi:endonuclease III
MKSNSKEIMDALDKIIPNPVCELNYNKDYELLIAVVLSARCTDARVNMATKELFGKYDIFDLAKMESSDIVDIIRPLGSKDKKSKFVISISKALVKDYNGTVPNDREYLESLPGVGRKTCNVVLSILYNESCMAVDTHVERISKRLGIALENDNVKVVEEKLTGFFPKDKLAKLHLQIVLFGRYHCKSVKPECNECILKDICLYYPIKKSSLN